jgi:hypothetical protein
MIDLRTKVLTPVDMRLLVENEWLLLAHSIFRVCHLKRDVFPHSIWDVLDYISPLHVVYALWPFLGEEETGIFALLNLTS